jgi:hypothetical protein
MLEGQKALPILLDFATGSMAESAAAAIIPETVDHEGEQGCPPMIKPERLLLSP